MERAPYFYSLQESYEKRRVQNDKGTQSVVNAKKKCVAVLLKESGRFGMTTDLWSFKFGVFFLVSTTSQHCSAVIIISSDWTLWAIHLGEILKVRHPGGHRYGWPWFGYCHQLRYAKDHQGDTLPTPSVHICMAGCHNVFNWFQLCIVDHPGNLAVGLYFCIGTKPHHPSTA